MEKTVDNFSTDKTSKDGKSYRCKDCNKICSNTYYLENREKCSGNSKKYREKHKEQLCIARKGYREENKEILTVKKHEYYIKNKEKMKVYNKNYRTLHKEHIRVTKRNAKRERKRTDPLYVLRCRLHTRIRDVFEIYLKNKRVPKSKFATYDQQEFKNHFDKFLDKPCICCNGPIITIKTANVEHIIPFGVIREEADAEILNSLKNIRLICSKCNNLKMPQDKQFIKKFRIIPQEIYKQELEKAVNGKEPTEV